jgi:cytoskeletal protein RodZ
LKKIFGLSQEFGYKPSYKNSGNDYIHFLKEPHIMNKTLFYIIITVIGLVTMTAIWYPTVNKPSDQEAASPANGLVGDTTEAATAKGTEEAPVEGTPAAATENTPAPAPSPNADTAASPAVTETAPTGDVPAGAEVSGEAPATADMPAEEAAPAMEEKPADGAVAPSEGQ